MMANTSKAGWNKLLDIWLVILFSFSSFLATQAKQNLIYRKAEGYYTRSGNDTMLASLLIPVSDNGEPDFTKLQSECIIVSNSQKQIEMHPTEVSGFGFQLADRSYHLISVKRSSRFFFFKMFTSKIFLSITNHYKELYLLSYYYIPSKFSGLETKTYLYGRDKQLIKTTAIGLTKRLIRHFGSCSQLASRIQKGYYKSYSIDFFIKDYQQLCQ